MNLDFSQPHFAAPVWLWLAGLAPLGLGGLFLWAERRRQHSLARLAASEFLPRLLGSHSPLRRRVKELVLVLAVFLLGLALARPQWGRQEENSVSLGEDVVFLLDCSASMGSTDIKPTRLARAKLAITDFAQQYHNGRLGLVVFAGQAFLQCPLTFDFDAFQESLNAVDDSTIPVPGTDIGRALNEGYAAVAKNDRRKILVLVSDGEDLEQGAVRVARALAAKDVVIFTIGVGTPAGSEIMQSDGHGGSAPLHDANGQVVVSKLDEPTLRAIAEATHGFYQPFGPVGDGLSRLRAVLTEHGAFQRFLATRLTGVDHFHLFIGLGLLLLVVESLLGTRRALPARPSGSRLGLLVILGLLAVSAAKADDAAPPNDARQLYNEGTQKLRSGDWHHAESPLNAAVPSGPEALQPTALYNLGIVRFRAGQELLTNAATPDSVRPPVGRALESAQQSLRQVDHALAGNDLADMMSAYQQARVTSHEVKALQKQLDGALQTYEKTMVRWLRSWGDFRSSMELKPGYTNAAYNADILDRHLAALRQQQQQMQAMQQALGQMKQQLKKGLSALKQKMPGGNGPDSPGGQGDDGDEDNGGHQGDNGEEPQNGSGDHDQEGHSGDQMALTPEEAQRLLSSLHSDLTRKYSFGDEQPQPPKKPTRTW